MEEHLWENETESEMGRYENNYTETDINCPPDYIEFENKYYFWMDGVALSSAAIPGMLMNFCAIFAILRHKSMHNFFNFLLISLFAFDSTYILTAMLNQSFLKQFNMTNKFSILMYPYFMHPLKHISLSASIFMTTAISYERSLAVATPIQYRLAMRSSKRRRLKLLMYISTVIVSSILFNIPKFMEIEVEWRAFNRYAMNISSDINMEVLVGKHVLQK